MVSDQFDVIELPLLLPEWQVNALETAARERGMTIGQLLRKLFSDLFPDQRPGTTELHHSLPPCNARQGVNRTGTRSSARPEKRLSRVEFVRNASSATASRNPGIEEPVETAADEQGEGGSFREPLEDGVGVHAELPRKIESALNQSLQQLPPP